ncbi:MAG: methyltransferase domain-containing protein [Cytophagales bacterium]|nr:methyltransferase domain-containing protein [Cytophagales bacterium]
MNKSSLIEEEKDVFGKGLYSFYRGNEEAAFTLHNDYGEPENMPVAHFFEEEITLLEDEALGLCRGDILDIGAGAGRHSLLLQSVMFKPKSIDISPLAVRLMQERGVKNAHLQNIWNVEGEQYDTLLMLMNGIGLAQTLDQVPVLLEKLKTLLKPGGRIVFDSSDLAYLYENEPLPHDKYYGEVAFRYTFEEKRSKWFGWVYVDPKTMQKMAEKAGFKFEKIYTDPNDQYLAMLTLKNS